MNIQYPKELNITDYVESGYWKAVRCSTKEEAEYEDLRLKNKKLPKGVFRGSANNFNENINAYFRFEPKFPKDVSLGDFMQYKTEKKINTIRTFVIIIAVLVAICTLAVLVCVAMDYLMMSHLISAVSNLKSSTHASS